ncbi:MAG: tetrahydromethanopterin S-methyltransferase subunit C [Candidatus Methanoperedens sp.]|nr:tetrahydromethanopterin S-methyltransferase subunit C [Candidatus Methanoperedens sp.]
MSDIKEISPEKLAAFGIIGGLAGIYLTYILPAVGKMAGGPVGMIFSVLAPTAGALGGICAVVWGAEAVRRVAKYGLGTGVPSIGQIAMGMGIIAAMFGLAIVKSVTQNPLGILAGPIVALVTASIIGFIIGWFAQNVIKMKIPVMIRCMTEIAAAGALVIIGFSAAVAGNFDFMGSIVPKVFDNGIMLAVFWVGAMAMLHPFNACLGPDEKQKRLLYLAGSTGAITMAVIGIGAIMTLGASGVVTLLLGIILWLIFYKKFWDEVYKDAAAVVGTGLIPKTEA